MTLIFIQLVQSVTGAVISIVALLLFAAIIGYFTAWFYAKSIYTPVIKRLETEKDELNKQVAALKDEISKLNNTVAELNATVGNLSDKINKLEMALTEKDKEIKALNKIR